MKSPNIALSLPKGLPSTAPAVPFPARARIAQLRQLREQLFREGKHGQALRVAETVAERDPGRESYCRLGMIYREVGRYREALRTLRDALRFEAGPEYLVPEIHLHTAHAWFLMGKRKRAGQCIQRAYQGRPKPRTAFKFHITFGNFLFSKQEYAEALKEYSAAEQAAPTAWARGQAAVNQGIVLVQQRKLQEAEVPLDRAIKALKKGRNKADLAIARAVRAWVHFEKGQHQRAFGMYLRAAEAFDKLGKLDREAEVLQAAGYLAIKLGLWTRSVTLLDRAINLASTTGQWNILSRAYACRAMACGHREDFDQAEINVNQAKRLLRGRRDWISTIFICRAEVCLASLRGRWRELFRWARRAERVATKAGDTWRVIEFKKLRAKAEERLGRKKAALYARRSAGRLESFVGTISPVMRRVSKTAAKLAGGRMAVLLVGESGCGKVHLARKIHRASPRSKGPCIVVPCENLSFPASDLQGHAQGAWSGAARGAGGYVAEAEGGTLILDRIDQLSHEGQRVVIAIVEGKSRPVGAAREVPIDVRVVATCQNPEKLMPELRHRLEGAVVNVPPLRQRKEEIPGLVAEALAGRRTITPEAVAILSSQRWEGNLPSLRAVVERLVANSSDAIGKKLTRLILKTTESRRVARVVYKTRRPRPAAALAF